MIEVHITAHERREWMNPVEEQKYIVTRLRNAGVPVVGAAMFLDIEHGKLEVQNRDGGLLFRWRSR